MTINKEISQENSHCKKRMFNEKAIQLALFIITLLINILFVYVHECWRDEAQAWLIARDNTLLSLFNITSYEGHPFLWFYILMPFARTGMPYVCMKLVSLFFVTITTFIIIYKLPFPIFLKSVIALSPAVIGFFVTPARSYSLCALFLVLLAVVYKKKNEKPIIYGALLALLLQTHIIMGGFVVSCGIVWLAEIIAGISAGKATKREVRRQCFGLILPLASGVFLLWEFRDVFNASAYGDVEREESIGVLGTMYASFWHKIKYLVGDYYAVPIIMFVLAVIICLCLRDRSTWGPTIIFVSAVLWQIYIDAYVYYCTYQIATWMYILLWYLTVCYSSIPNIQHLSFISGDRKERLFIIVFFSAVFLLGLWGKMGRNIWADFYLPFSASKDTAVVIDQLPEDAVIFVNEGERCASVAPYLRKKTIYDPFTQAPVSYFNRRPEFSHEPMSLSDFAVVCKRMFPGSKGVFILCSQEGNAIQVSDEEAEGLQLLWSSQSLYDETIEDETYDIRYMTFE